jgi:cytochrome c oxidase cbb3-type subunit IV
MSNIDLIRSLVTLVSFVSFLGIVAWAYSRGSRKGFDRAANSIFEE